MQYLQDCDAWVTSSPLPTYIYLKSLNLRKCEIEKNK